MSAEKIMPDKGIAARLAVTYGIALCPDGARTFEVTASFDESVGADKPFAFDGIGYSAIKAKEVTGRITSALRNSGITTRNPGIRVSISPALTWTDPSKTFESAEELDLAIAVAVARLCGSDARVPDGRSDIKWDELAYSGEVGAYGAIEKSAEGNFAKMLEAGARHLVTNCDEIHIDGYKMFSAKRLSDIISPNATPVMEAIVDAFNGCGVVVVDVSEAYNKFERIRWGFRDFVSCNEDDYLRELTSSIAIATESLPCVQKPKRMSVAKAMSESKACDEDVIAMVRTGQRPSYGIGYGRMSWDAELSVLIGNEKNGNVGEMTRCAGGVLLIARADRLEDDAVAELKKVIKQGCVTTDDGRNRVPPRMLPAIVVFASNVRESSERLADKFGVKITEYAEYGVRKVHHILEDEFEDDCLEELEDGVE